MRIIMLGAAALAGGLALASLGGNTVEAQLAAPDAIYFNANVVTVDDRFSFAQAVAVSSDKFVAVGSNDEVRKLAGPSTRLVDLRGKTVVPGLTDNHLHGAGGGPGVDLSGTRSIDEVLAAVAARVRQSDPGEVVVSNSDWHEAQLKEQRLPLRRDLDKVAPTTPVVLVRGGHEYVLNSAALAKWNVTTSTPEPAGGRITRYPDGELNGELVDRARQLVALPRPAARSLEQRIQDQITEYNKLHAAGLTAVRHPGGSIEEYRMRQDMQRRGVLTMRVTQLLSVERGAAGADIEKVIAGWSVRPDEGDAMLRVGGIKLGVDGGFEGGFMREPYEEPFGEGGTYRGLQTVPQARFTEAVRAINRQGWRVFTHAVGDAAIDEVLEGYEAASADRSIVGKRWGIEHAFMGRPDQFDRMKRLGLAISAQNHLYLAGPSLVKYWGAKRASWTTPVKAYLQAGLPVSGGTDSAVVPYPPLWVFYHFFTRDTISGGPLGTDQRISREDALRLITRNHWYLSFQENTSGIIAPGRYADMVVLDDNLLKMPENRVEQLKVLMTMVAGRTVYRNGEFGAVITE